MSGATPSPLDRVATRILEQHPACGIVAPLLDIRERDPGADDALRALLDSGARRLDERFARVAGTTGVPVLTTIGSAIRDVGFRRVHAVALVTTTITECSEPSTNLDPIAFWRYACAVGTLATLSATMDGRFTDEAFAAGFFHVLGRMLLDQHTPEEFGRVARLVHEERLPLLQAESTVYGFTEADLVGAVGLRWGFPGWLVEALLAAAQPSDDLSRHRQTLPALVLRARLAAATRGFGTEFEPAGPPPASARWLVEPLLLALDRLGGRDWLENRVTAALRVALLDDL